MPYELHLSGQDFKDLATVASFAEKGTHRPLLQVVKFEITANSVRAIATDSYKLATMTREAKLDITGDTEQVEHLSVLIPAERLTTFAKGLKAARGSFLPDVVVKFYDPERGGVLFESEGYVMGGDLVEGKYPEVDHLIPKPEGVKECNRVAFNAAMLADFAKLAPFNSKDPKEATLIITALPDDKHPMRVEDQSGRTIALLMPVRIN